MIHYSSETIVVNKSLSPGPQVLVDDVTVVVLHFTAATPPLHPGRPASIPPSATSNDAANASSFLTAYRKAAAQQLPESRNTLGNHVEEGTTIQAVISGPESRGAVEMQSTQEGWHSSSSTSRLSVASTFEEVLALSSEAFSSQYTHTTTRYSATSKP